MSGKSVVGKAAEGVSADTKAEDGSATMTVKDAIILASESPASAVELGATIVASMWATMDDAAKVGALAPLGARKGHDGRAMLGKVNALLAGPEERAKIVVAKLAAAKDVPNLVELGKKAFAASLAAANAAAAFDAAVNTEAVATILTDWHIVPEPAEKGVMWRDVPIKKTARGGGGGGGTRKSPAKVGWRYTDAKGAVTVYAHNPKASSGVAFITALAGADVAADYSKGTCGVRAALKFWNEKASDYPGATLQMVVSGEMAEAAGKMANELAAKAGGRFSIQ